ncbi:MAG TPA: phosphoribosylformylglycinamidine cyclo-ligase [Nitrospiraceae bacterium]|nr:MAG: phosphoribosylformylglycinamidine cyclo-ligase [Nitrospirae bacterium GWA2_46_11]OGW24154.1 MAG: phosphoribosylformylglycinamidine cyclo-ligase [Nitrospirae bacterium GWB2_47_37]HAK89129.1 phosphoribosylformylglycinamidine cyclo-ligase [Nitrospiraceae bacterium]HCZ10836.1 phosphoribosylformylglycinamidine cyclo-ligase [Nitrospiraceae bacterium]
MEELTYKKAGVDIDEGDRFVSLISPMAKRTFRPEVMMDIGSFGALFKLDIEKYKEPVLVSGTDGVGTKLKIAFMTGRHDTVGIDLVAMCVNDILTLGAEPLFFLDYFATGKLDAEKHSNVVKGIAEGCKDAGCALIGGETAEMPGFYKEDEYDMAGFAVGVVDKNEIVSGSKIKEGDAVIGIASSGLHSNGYSLVRKVFFDAASFTLDKYLPELDTTLGEELLKPTRIYVKALNALRGKAVINGMAHITGGGITGNLPRVIQDGLAAIIGKNSWPVPPVFGLIQKLGNVPDEDMKKTFNMGIGYVIVLPEKDADFSISVLKQCGLDAYRIGFIEKGGKEKIRYV